MSDRTVNASDLAVGDTVRLGRDIRPFRSGRIAKVVLSEFYANVVFTDGHTGAFRLDDSVVVL